MSNGTKSAIQEKILALIPEGKNVYLVRVKDLAVKLNIEYAFLYSVILKMKQNKIITVSSCGRKGIEIARYSAIKSLKKDGYLAMVNQIMIDMSDIGVARDKGYGNDR